MRGALVAIVAVVGCGASSRTSSSGQSLECGPVIARLVGRSEAFAKQVWGDRQPMTQQQLDAIVERFVPPMVHSCRDDHWSDDMLYCLDEMTVTDEPQKCNHFLTQDQAVALAQRVMAATRGMIDQGSSQTSSQSR